MAPRINRYPFAAFVVSGKYSDHHTVGHGIFVDELVVAPAHVSIILDLNDAVKNKGAVCTAVKGNIVFFERGIGL